MDRAAGVADRVVSRRCDIGHYRYHNYNEYQKLREDGMKHRWQIRLKSVVYHGNVVHSANISPSVLSYYGDSLLHLFLFLPGERRRKPPFDLMSTLSGCSVLPIKLISIGARNCRIYPWMNRKVSISVLRQNRAIKYWLQDPLRSSRLGTRSMYTASTMLLVYRH